MKSQTRKNRFGIVAPASFSRRSRDGALQRAEGTTRDISHDGIFICTHQMPAAGTELALNVSFGASEDTGMNVRLKGTGTVLRINTTDEQSSGFAAAVNLIIVDMRAPSNPESDR